tara:strand:- start:143 stop:250 length:108 start_codon:yes stop_codon:yes gene_type:complete
MILVGCKMLRHIVLARKVVGRTYYFWVNGDLEAKT